MPTPSQQGEEHQLYNPVLILPNIADSLSLGQNPMEVKIVKIPYAHNGQL